MVPLAIVLLGSLLAFAEDARAFVLNLNTNNQVRHWDLVNISPDISTNSLNPTTKAIRFFLASDAFSTTNTAAELNAIRASFAQWQAITNTSLKFEDAGLLAPGLEVNLSDGTNIVYWAKSSQAIAHISLSGTLALTFTSFFEDNTIAEGDIAINGMQFGWFTDFFDTNAANTNFFVEAVAAHEIGHLVGLEHSPVGGSTMLVRGGSGLSTQIGLSEDDQAAARFLYGNASLLTNLSTLQGQVTKSSVGVFGAAVLVETNGNLVSGTVTRSNGFYSLPGLRPGNYQARVAPLDPSSLNRLIAGVDISSTFSSADTNFIFTSGTAVTLTAGQTNTQNLTVISSAPAFRVTHIRPPTADSFTFSAINSPASIYPGQSNLIVGVYGPALPTNGATLTISGDGLTLGSPTFVTNIFFANGQFLNGISVPINVSSNATPGLRSFIVQQGTNVAYASGFIEVLPLVPDINFDGLDDNFQRKYFPLFTAPQAAPTADPDNDTFNNLAESIAGSNPTNSASLLRVESVTQNASGTTIAWQSAPGKKYQVAGRSQFGSGGAWANLGSAITATNSLAQFLDAGATNGIKFYRVQALP